MRFLIAAMSLAALVFSGNVALADAAAPATVAQAGEVELEFWRSIRDNNVEELNAYLASYPNGTFKSLALARIAAIKNGSSTTRNLTTGVDPSTFKDTADQISEDQIGLDKDQRRDVQRRLTGLGFDIKATGKFDDETRSVIKRWQAARGYPATGYLNKLQHKAMQSEIVSTRVASADDSDDEPARHRSSAGSGRRYHSSGGGGGKDGAGALFGHVVGGLFGR
jgi:hypothetical protein